MALKARTVFRVIAVAVILGALAYRHWHRPEPPAMAAADAAPLTAPVETREPSQPARSWRRGSLAFTSCELARPGSGTHVQAWCSTLDVPENRADPHGRHIRLKLAIARSDAQVPEPDLVTLLAGGPGEAATEAWVLEAPAFADVRKHHDVLLLDQRGTGGSNPLSCKSAEQASDQHALTLDLDTVRKDVAACLDEVKQKADPRYYTTTIAVADLEAVRQALGAPKFDLVGISYGTRMAQQYATAHPDAVRSIVLDSVAPNTLILGETFASDLERALKLQADACVATPACNKAFGDWRKTLLALHAQLDAKPVPDVTFRDPRTNEPVTRTVTGDTLAGLVHLFAYNAEASALLPLDVAQAAKGDYVPLLGQTQIGRGDLDGGMNAGMQLSVMCTEDAPFLKPRPEDAGTLLGTLPIERIQTACAVWPRGEMPEDFHQPFKSSIPTLILSGERDPVTPPRFAEEVLKGLSKGRVLSLKGMGHGELMIGCMPKLVNEFIDKLDPKQLDAECLKRIGPVPAFVNFNGAAP